MIISWLSTATEKLQRAGVTSARLDAELLLAHTLGVDRTWLHAHGEAQLTPQQAVELNRIVQRRLQREPIAYIIGHKEFYGRDFIVTPNVLIPRPESETMIELLTDICFKHTPYDGKRLVDVGTGSGCLGITAKLELAELEVTLTDISPAALAVATRNARHLHADLKTAESDLLSKFQSLDSRFDVILANLPYVDTSWERSPETDHEPALALFADDQGLALIKKLIIQASNVLQPGGYLLLEADPEQHAAITTHARHDGFILEMISDYIVVLRK